MAKKEVKQSIEVERVERPWGWYETIQEEEKYKVKRLHIRRGQRISLQSHDHRDEHWIVVEGFGLVEVDENERHVGLGGHIFVPKKHKHRITATKDMTIIEVQMGSCNENDIHRYQDDYGRIS